MSAAPAVVGDRAGWRLTAVQADQVVANLGLASALLAREYPHLVGCPDARQDAAVGLMRAAVDWDPDRGAFSTYAYQAIRWAVQAGLNHRRGYGYRSARAHGWGWQPPLSLDQLADDDGDGTPGLEVAEARPGPDQTAQDRQLLALVAQALRDAARDGLDRDVAAQILAKGLGGHTDSYRTLARRHQVSVWAVAERTKRLQQAAQRAVIAAGWTATPTPRQARGPAEHGTRSRYVAGCHCDACRAASAAYHRRRRLTGRSLPVPDLRTKEPTR